MFSYDEYTSILEGFSGRWCSFFEISDKPFAVMRHDVEFSVERAFLLGKVEHENNVRSTFNFQVACNTYNVVSNKSREQILSLHSFGHEIGLHYYASHIEEGNLDELVIDLHRQRDILQRAVGLEIKTFSFHRPQQWMLAALRDDFVGGLLNQYGNSFFEYDPAPTRVKYVADSRHGWDYGYPLDFVSSRQIQVLTHPDEWSEKGGDEEANFRAIKAELSQNISEAFMDESPRNFAKYEGKI